MLKKLFNLLFGIKETPKRESIYKDYDGMNAAHMKTLSQLAKRTVEKDKYKLPPKPPIPRRVYNASPGHSFNNNTSTHYVDNTSSIVQAAVLYSVLSDSSESVGTRVDSHSGSNEQYCSSSSSSSYSSSDSYSSCDSSSSYSGSCD